MNSVTDSSYVPFPILGKSDFPPIYDNFSHPNDYKKSAVKANDRFIYKGRKFVRTSFRYKGEYTAFTFVCDPKRPFGMYLCKTARQYIDPIIKRDFLGFEYSCFSNAKRELSHIMIEESPQDGLNILGLKTM